MPTEPMPPSAQEPESTPSGLGQGSVGADNGLVHSPVPEASQSQGDQGEGDGDRSLDATGRTTPELVGTAEVRANDESAGQDADGSAPGPAEATLMAEPGAGRRASPEKDASDCPREDPGVEGGDGGAAASTVDAQDPGVSADDEVDGVEGDATEQEASSPPPANSEPADGAGGEDKPAVLFVYRKPVSGMT